MSMLFFILIVLGLTLVAGGVGFWGGLQILSSAERTIRGKTAEPSGLLGEMQHGANPNLKVLTPIVANLAGSPPVWIRIESSLVFRDEIPGDADGLAVRITEDIVGFLRTLSVKDIEGATGFQHLSEDLNDRVRVRSDGRVRELIIQGLIVE
jgi:flagellar FliL protein